MKSQMFRTICLGICASGLVMLLTAGSAFASENERYKAIPISTGGYVFIIDTREGHMWTWNNAGVGQTSPSGENPKVVYQGNVRNNMKVPPPPPPQVSQSQSVMQYEQSRRR